MLAYKAYWMFYEKEALLSVRCTQEQADRGLVAAIRDKLQAGERSFVLDAVELRVHANESACIASIGSAGGWEVYVLMQSGKDGGADATLKMQFQEQHELARWRPEHEAVLFEKPFYYMTIVRSRPLRKVDAKRFWPIIKSNADALAVAFFQSKGVG